MALKTYNPTTPGQRQLVMVDRSALYKGKPVKALTEGKISNGGRNNTGRITVRFRGGGHKKAYRMVDFKRNKVDVPAVVERLEYDPNRTAFIALIKYQDGEQAYILAPQRLAVGDTIVAGSYVDVKPGNVMPLGNMPVGTIGHNIEMKIGKGRHLGRPPPGDPVGQADQGQEDPVEQVDQPIHSPQPPQAEEVRNTGHGSFSLERPVRRRLAAQEGRCRSRVRPSRRHQDLEPPLDHSAAVRRPRVRRLQRPETRARLGERGNGRSQVRRVLADPDLPRPFGRQESQESLRLGLRIRFED